jgi:hypothetical protein
MEPAEDQGQVKRKRSCLIFVLPTDFGGSTKIFFLLWWHARLIRYRSSLHGSKIGGAMARYISQHTLACLTRQGAEELTKRLYAGTAVTARRVLVNMQEGKMLVEFDAPAREDLEKWLAAEKFHFDWLLRLELESSSGGPLQPVS